MIFHGGFSIDDLWLEYLLKAKTWDRWTSQKRFSRRFTFSFLVLGFGPLLYFLILHVPKISHNIFAASKSRSSRLAFPVKINRTKIPKSIFIYTYIYMYKCCKYRRLMKVMFIIVYPCLSIFKAPERPRPCTTCPAIISRCLACHRSFSTHWRSIDFPNRCQRSRRSRPCHWQWPRNPAPTSDPWRRTTRRTGSGSHDTRSGRD